MILSMNDTLEFIKDYQEQRVLWDKNYSDYLNHEERLVSLRILSKKYHVDTKSIKAKFKSLRTYFSKEHHKLIQKRRSGDKSYKCQWFAYDAMLFLLNLESKPPTIPSHDSKNVTTFSMEKIDSLAEMTKNKTLNFIADYHAQQILWDKNHKDYYDQIKRNSAINDLSQKYSADVFEIKQKIKSLRSYFKQEHQNVLKNRLCNENYNSAWYGYNAMLFLKNEVIAPELTDMNNLFHFNDEHENHLDDECSDANVGLLEKFTVDLMDMLQGHIMQRKTNTSVKDTLKEEHASGMETSDFFQLNHYECSEENVISYEEPILNQVDNLETQSRKRKFNSSTEDILEKAVYSSGLNRNCVGLSSDNECVLFGKFIAAKMQKLSPRSQMIAQNKIMSWLLDLQLKEMKSLEKGKCFNSSDEVNRTNATIEAEELITIKLT